MIDDELCMINPSFEDLCAVIEGYEKFYDLLNSLVNINDTLIEHGKRAIMHDEVYDKVIFKNFDDFKIIHYYDNAARKDVVEIRILKEGKFLPDKILKVEHNGEIYDLF